MKPNEQVPGEPIDIEKAFEEGTLIDEAMNEAVRQAVKRHRDAGMPLVVWRDGKVALISTDDHAASP